MRTGGNFILAMALVALALTTSVAASAPFQGVPADAPATTATAPTPKCALGAPDALCVVAHATASVGCTLTAATYECVLGATYGGTGSTALPAPGQVDLAGSYVEFVVCDASSMVCIPQMETVSANCQWGVTEDGCVATGDWSKSVSGEYKDCFAADVLVRSSPSAYPPGPALFPVVEDTIYVHDVFTNCE